MKTNIKLCLVLMLLIVGLSGCSTESNTESTAEWITKHKKPITVKLNSMNMLTYTYRYTLRDSSNNFYYTGEIDLNLPDTIR